MEKTLTEEERKEAMDWAKKTHPHLLENTEMVFMLWRKQAKQERITEQPFAGVTFSFLNATKHKTFYRGVVTIVEVVRTQREWKRCQSCYRKDANCRCETKRFDTIQNTVYLVGDNTMTIQAEKYVINGNKADLLEEGKTYWVRFVKEYSNYWNTDVIEIKQAEELVPEQAKAYIDFWDTFAMVHSYQMPGGTFQAFCKKKNVTADDILSKFNLMMQNDTLVRRE